MNTSVLLVDDNRRLIEHTSKNLFDMRPEWNVMPASSCAEARRIMGEADFMPDAAVLDFALPDGNGLDLMDELMQMIPALPVIMISGSVSDNLKENVKTNGGYAFVEKPFYIGSLVDQVEQAMTHMKSPGVTMERKVVTTTALCVLPENRALALNHKPDFKTLLNIA